MITDIGEHIPYAKKETVLATTGKEKGEAKPPKVTLKRLWPEPDWKSLFLDGIPVTVLSSIYAIYHSLAKQPHTTERFSFGGIKVTQAMWESAYIESVTYLRSASEAATTTACINDMETAFAEHFHINGKASYKTYAAGTRTPKTFFHPLGRNGAAAQYEKALRMLDWPMGVNAKKIPFLPIKLIYKSTGKKTFSLGKYNKKSASCHGSRYGYENEFESFEDAIEALVKYHGKDFLIVEKQPEQRNRYTPKKNMNAIQGVNESYPDVDPQTLMDDFHFRGLQFGNYLPQKERQAYVTNTYYSLNLLTDILKIPASWIGGGKLGLAFGARGHGFSAAHYERDLNVINLTRFNGPGTISHELFHNFDYRFAKRWCNVDDMLSNLIISGDVSIDDVDTAYHKQFETFKQLVCACTQQSSFVTNATALNGQKGAAKYWTQPTELCARAFEAYIQDTMNDIGISHQWLAFGTQPSDYPNNGMHPYPVGDDRKRLNNIFTASLPAIFN